MKPILIITLFFMQIALYAESFNGIFSLSTNAGYSHSDDRGNVMGADIHSSFFIFNASAEVYKWDKIGSNNNDTTYGIYGGLGFLHLAELQVGSFGNKVAGRFRANVAYNWREETWKNIILSPDDRGRGFAGVPVGSIILETNDDGFRYGFMIGLFW